VWTAPERRDDGSRVVACRGGGGGPSHLESYFVLLTGVADRAEQRLGAFGLFTPAEVAAFVGDAFLSAETMLLLLDVFEADVPHRAALAGWRRGYANSRKGEGGRSMMRARQPDLEGFVESDGIKIGYEVFGRGSPTLLLLPTWTIVHSRFWKMQVPYLADHFRVVTFDGPGNGRSDRSTDTRHYGVKSAVRQALDVLEATQTDQAVLASLSRGSQEALALCADHADRVLGAVFIGAGLMVEPLHPERTAAAAAFLNPCSADAEGWARLNARFWTDQYVKFAEFFFAECFSEPHSTKQREDCVGWAGETTPEVLLTDSAASSSPEEVEAWASRVAVPTLFIHGDDDRISPLRRAELFQRLTGGEVAVLEGAGHMPLVRDPVQVNLLIRDFVERLAGTSPKRSWTRGKHRARRALFISSPIGLGHARRDLAVAEELRQLHPDLEIEWLAQHPVTRVLEDSGEKVHPASARLSSESAHIESESGEHRLHCFQAWRKMDEILLNDFMVFHDVVNERDYDLVIGDEAWDVDYYLHENPELKRFAYCWLTDFVGWLPMPEGGDREAYLTADYNAEMIEHIARYPRVRDLALFVGNPDDIVPDRFGDELPFIRSWTEEHYKFPGYITGFDPLAVTNRDQVRDELGYAPDDKLCVVTVGGSGVGEDLLRRLIEAHPAAAERVPGLRMLIVAGPRIDPDSLPRRAGVDVRRYVPELYRYLAASDLAVVQGGLTTCMELTATNRPFIYLPLGQHFEQQFHVHHRLQRHRAGRRMDFAGADPDLLADAMALEVERPTDDYCHVETDGAARAAAAIAELI
jgi:pimeloyl-ACP methyl ester carboxylesterase/predicted glycosyltransferase